MTTPTETENSPTGASAMNSQAPGDHIMNVLKKTTVLPTVATIPKMIRKKAHAASRRFFCTASEYGGDVAADAIAL